MDTTFYFNAGDEQGCFSFTERLSLMINENISENQEIVYLCIGSDRSTGDCLGPLVGHALIKQPAFEGCVYGTLKNPVHAVNLSKYMEDIYSIHRDPFVVAIDASLGLKKHIGFVTLGNTPLKPGLGVKKQLPEVGNISVTGIVNVSGFLDSMVLQTTRLSSVMSMADYIADGITAASRLRYTDGILLGIL